MRLLLFNLKTDSQDPVLGFTTLWVRALAERVTSVSVLTMVAGSIELPDNVTLASVGKEAGYSEARRGIEFYKKLAHILRVERPDACFSHMIPLFSIMAAPVLRPLGIPITTWYAHPSLTRTLRVAHTASTRVVTSVPPAYPYKHDRKLIPIGQGIDVGMFSPGPPIRGNEKLILCVGRLSPSKNHDVLIRAFAEVCRMGHDDIKLAIVGNPLSEADDPYVESLHRSVAELGIEDRVEFRRGVPIHELPEIYRQATIHVNLTPTGFGDKVALEAMSCAVPCLVSNEGFAETLGTHASELLYAYRDTGDLAKRLDHLLGLSSEERAAIGAYLRQSIKDRHSLDSLVERLLLVIEESRPARRTRKGRNDRVGQR